MFCIHIAMQGCARLCCGYADAVQGYIRSRPKAVQSQAIAILRDPVGLSVDLCGSMYDDNWSKFVLFGMRVAEVLRDLSFRY